MTTTDDAVSGSFDGDVAAVCKAAGLLSALVDQLGRGRVPRLGAQVVVDLAVRTLSGAWCADILAWRDGEFVTVAASADYPRELDDVRVAAAHGPCYDALDKPAPVVSDELYADARYPAFGPQAWHHWGIRSIASWRLQLPGPEPGALSCYSDWPYAFSALDVAAGTILADCCSLSTYFT